MNHPSIETCDNYFATSFAEARHNWLDDINYLKPSLQQNNWGEISATSINHPLPGPEQESLATDLLWLGKADSKQVAVIISGTHGIEGYAGNAVQRYLLAALVNEKLRPSEDTAFLFIHAINPWGMAWRRRCDENGIDLNRNYVDFNALPQNAAYQRLQHCLTIADPNQRQAALQQQAIALGQKAYEVAISGGQYSDPFGPFYGGRNASHGQKVSKQVIRDYALDDKTIIVIDVHSGLGAWGFGEMISDHPLDHKLESPNDRFAQQLFGPGVTNPARGDSSSVAKSGLQDYYWHQAMSSRGCYLTLEFGSYSVQRLFDVIIDDHRLWRDMFREIDTNAQSLSPDKLSTIKTLPNDIVQHQKAMMEHFCPSDIYWRQLVLFQAGQVGDRLLKFFRSNRGI